LRAAVAFGPKTAARSSAVSMPVPVTVTTSTADSSVL
jgi:hypothetical protein